MGEWCVNFDGGLDDLREKGEEIDGDVGEGKVLEPVGRFLGERWVGGKERVGGWVGGWYALEEVSRGQGIEEFVGHLAGLGAGDGEGADAVLLFG